MIPEVCWQAPLFGETGYAIEARAFVLGLDELGVRVAPRHRYGAQSACRLAPRDRRRLTALGRAASAVAAAHVSRRRLSRAMPAVYVHHAFPNRWRRENRASGNIGRTMFETDRLPAGWARACNEMDEIWVPSRFNADTFSAAGVRPSKLVIVPSPIRLRDFDRSPAPLPRPSRRFIFLSIFDWSWRKGWDVLLRAFCAEFDRDHDEVALLLKVHSSYGLLGAELRHRVRDFVEHEIGLPLRRAPAIRLVTQRLPTYVLSRLYKSADCFVLPSRGEGWGRPLMEAMAVGLPVIGTRWSGNLEYMTDRNSYLCDIQALVPVPADAVREAPVFRGHRWAEPSVDHLRQLMRGVVERRAEARAKGRRARADIAQGFDVRIVCRQVADRLASHAV